MDPPSWDWEAVCSERASCACDLEVATLFFSIYGSPQSWVVYLTKVRRDDDEGDLVVNHRGVWVLLPPSLLGVEPIRVAVLDFSGIPFADAAGAREVVQVRRGSREARKNSLSSRSHS